ncbi:C39 family peptidase [Streptomyces sp. NPDC052042]|uniref:C39 family peptidase n=1 Tax=Streptomyces sp. NPDC052042 TaxID=3365683 RepID=UPI0037D65688
MTTTTTTTTPTEKRPSASRRRVRLAAAAITALATAGVLVPAGTASAQLAPPRPGNYPAKKSLSAYKFQTQSTYYYCGPAATRLALTQRNKTVSQKTLAKDLKVEQNGKQTDNIGLVTKTLNKRGKTSWYENKWIPGNTATSAQVKRLKADIRLDINKGYAIVANVYGTAYDTAGKKHAYNQGHYLTVVGYTNNGDKAVIEDIAIGSSKRHKYTMTTKKLATWIATRGYSA